MKNIGDPAEFLKVYDIDKEEALTAAAMARGQTPEGFGEMAKSTDIRAGDDPFDPFTAFFDDDEPYMGETVEDVAGFMPTLFPDDLSYFKEVVEHPRAGGEAVKASFDPEEGRVDLTRPRISSSVSGFCLARSAP